ncbi:L,D-transpeptidase family protein [Clostridium ganghwense]|uniref:L,D-transpeptidase family protein n=1 Tax=Clostridium ganghwense TaxID=312089 RepID=A0ABT4CV10_9CLOT|nr:L,D-transpeptidase family protein [Clostridium ganghwense]MCY6372283.1 L,D-transpeptidase family protein [Clostridium ganghwense]
MIKKSLLFFIIISTTFLIIIVTNILKKDIPTKNIAHTLSTDDTGNNYFFKEPQNPPSSTWIKIYKTSRTLELYGDDKLIGRFKIVLGQNPKGDKNKEGDSKTPEGKYYICTRNDKSKFTLFLGLSYPNIEDAKRGLENGLIDSYTFNKIKKAIENKQQPPWNTSLGGAVGIHGGGDNHNWTAGCIALSDEAIHIIWKYTNYGTSIEILK